MTSSSDPLPQPVMNAKGTQADVFALVLTRGAMSRTELATAMGVSQPTITKAVSPLIDSGYLVEQGERASTGGRPQKLLEVDPKKHVVVGLKLAPASITGVLTDLRAEVLRRVDVPVTDHSPDVLLGAAGGLACELLDGVASRALGVGVAVGGHIDTGRGVCRHSGILEWHGVDVATPIAAATGLPVVVNNDVNALAVEEGWFGAGRDDSSFAVVTVGAGVGCGLVIGGELLAGATGLAGELGHIPLDPDGPDCSCGNRGCLEAIASEEAILRAVARRRGPALSSIEEAVELARGPRRAGRKAARDTFRAAGDAVGRGIAVLLNVLNLQKVVLSGEGIVASDLFGEAMQEALGAHAFSTASADCELVVRELGDDAWARGAACLVIQAAVGATPEARASEAAGVR